MRDLVLQVPGHLAPPGRWKIGRRRPIGEEILGISHSDARSPDRGVLAPSSGQEPLSLVASLFLVASCY